MKMKRIVRWCVCGAMCVAGMAAVPLHAHTNEAAQTAVSNETASVAATNVVGKVLDGIVEQAEAMSARYAWAQTSVWGVEVWQVVWVVGIIVITIMMAQAVSYAVYTQLARVFARRAVPHSERIMRSVQRPLRSMVYLGGIMIAVSLTPLKHTAAWRALETIGTLLLALMVIWLMDRIIDVLTHIWIVKARTATPRTDEHLIVLGRKVAKVVAFMLVVIVLLDTLHIDITALVTGLGLGGLAVALALQDTLANFFSSVYIMLDRPFKVGDRIETENIDGFVEEIGFRSTRIRTLTKTQVTMPNKTIANASVNNITRMNKHRVTQTLGVTYHTTAEQMEKALEALRAVLQSDPEIDKEFIVVRFYDFGESSLNINVVYFTVMAEYEQYLAVRERINLQFMRTLAGMGVAIAFPTRTVQIENVEARQETKE